ncbi:glycosyltransferase [Roseibium aestuarii]|uniref:Glycosyltransferase n=1 Tax=Roseibium aestuarii TaxID=2600299 RepID=A0ABW4JQI4_9HYPH|nr:glycosyltransferase [Roseibium aestuarii]
MTSATAASAPTLTIVIPHLNQPGHLANCLRSLEAQTAAMDDVEIIVVDNGSKELPHALCAGSHLDVRLTQEATPGPGPARNHGISLARSELLAFIDADCLAHPGWVADIRDAFSDPSVQVVGGDVRIALKDPQRLTTLEAYESVYAYRQKMYIEKQGFSGTGNLAMRRPVHAQVGPFAGIGVAEDRDWGQRATRLGLKIHYRPGMIAYHPAREKMDELYTKWDRHIAHDYAEVKPDLRSRAIWVIKALALAASPLWEVARIVASDRISGLRPRLRALKGLAIIRLFRARRMLAQIAREGGAVSSTSWNR